MFALIEDDNGNLAFSDGQAPKEGTPAHLAWHKIKSVYGCIAPRSELMPPPPEKAPVTVEETASWLRQKFDKFCGQDEVDQTRCAGPTYNHPHKYNTSTLCLIWIIVLAFSL
jgi:hypothetical protein